MKWSEPHHTAGLGPSGWQLLNLIVCYHHLPCYPHQCLSLISFLDAHKMILSAQEPTAQTSSTQKPDNLILLQKASGQLLRLLSLIARFSRSRALSSLDLGCCGRKHRWRGQPKFQYKRQREAWKQAATLQNRWKIHLSFHWAPADFLSK